MIRNLTGFGCRILCYDVNPQPEEVKPAAYVSLDELIRESDIISLHTPGIPETYHMIGAEEISRMKKGVILVNCGRGSLIDTDAMILRKGSVSAKEGERLLIPINMKDGSLICTGMGNPEWNCSAPHGAGRLFSRHEARKRYTLEEFEKEMDGIFTTSISYDTLDECPMAYKSMEEILENIDETASVEKVIRPVYNYKAGE